MVQCTENIMRRRNKFFLTSFCAPKSSEIKPSFIHQRIYVYKYGEVLENSTLILLRGSFRKIAFQHILKVSCSKWRHFEISSLHYRLPLIIVQQKKQKSEYCKHFSIHFFVHSFVFMFVSLVSNIYEYDTAILSGILGRNLGNKFIT